MSVTFRPFADQVLLRPCKHKPPKTESGVTGDPNANDPFPVARVVAVGPEVKEAAAGQLVMFRRECGRFLTGGELLVWTFEKYVHGEVLGEDAASLDEGITEEQLKARAESDAQARRDAERKRELMVGSTAPVRGHVYVDGRRHH